MSPLIHYVLATAILLLGGTATTNVFMAQLMIRMQSCRYRWVAPGHSAFAQWIVGTTKLIFWWVMEICFQWTGSFKKFISTGKENVMRYFAHTYFYYIDPAFHEVRTHVARESTSPFVGSWITSCQIRVVVGSTWGHAVCRISHTRLRQKAACMVRQVCSRIAYEFFVKNLLPPNK